MRSPSESVWTLDLRQLCGRYDFGQEKLLHVPNSDHYDGHNFSSESFHLSHMVVLNQGLLSYGEKKADGV